MDEPPLLLRWAMYHFAGCEAFLLGLSFFCVAQLVLLRSPVGRPRMAAVIAARLGLIWAFAVPAPVPRGLLVVFAISLVGLGLAARKTPPTDGTADTPATPYRTEVWRWLVAGCALALILSEIPHRLAPRLVERPHRLLIVADSVTAGLNDGEDTWPQRLARSTTLDIVDASQPGATLKSGLRQLELLDTQPSMLLLEIGGNDLLEGLPVAQFTHDLEQLLATAQQPERTVWMFELPMPPLACRYGEVQRRLAHQYKVTLIPRRFLLQVLTSSEGTVDGIHLAPPGHQRLAELVQKMLKLDNAFLERTGSYRHVEPARKHERSIP